MKSSQRGTGGPSESCQAPSSSGNDSQQGGRTLPGTTVSIFKSSLKICCPGKDGRFSESFQLIESQPSRFPTAKHVLSSTGEQNPNLVLIRRAASWLPGSRMKGGQSPRSEESPFTLTPVCSQSTEREDLTLRFLKIFFTHL